ncbi:hypothetical protein KC887_02330 [Candidatus Kaiserbacteria bacterium]|nr:hypothetical protein [Candidatus Kaiserbacteria bacterium]
MKLIDKLPAKLAKPAAQLAVKVDKNAPHIMFGVGIVGVVAGTVLACRATLRTEPILDEFRADVAAVKADMADTEDYKRDLAYAYFHGTKQIAKEFAVPVIVLTGSLGLLTGAHIKLTRQNAALTAAYTALHQAYENYRARVREEVGEEREIQLYHGIHEVEDVDGKKVLAVDPNNTSPYARFFDELSTEFRKDSETNKAFLMAQQNYHNDILQVKGHLFLNEVYDALGLPRSSAGQHVGWTVGGAGDGFVDFGIFNVRNNRFIEGSERALLLDFNVDGVITPYI